jgi:hypothetical protein
MHIEKCGGAFAFSIIHLCCPSRSRPDGKEALMTVPLALEPDGANVCPTCRILHNIPFSTSWMRGYTFPFHHPLRPFEAPRAVAVFRRPVARLISDWHFRNPARGAPYSVVNTRGAVFRCGAELRACNGSDFMDYVLSTPAPLRTYAERSHNRGCQARMVLGLKCYGPRPDTPPEDVSHRAAEAVALARTFAFVGLTEQWNATVRLLYWTFGRSHQAMHPNELPAHPKLRANTYGRGRDVTQEEEQLVGWQDAADEPLYAEAQRLFAERKAAATASGLLGVDD